MLTRLLEMDLMQQTQNEDDTLALVLLVIVFVLMMAWVLYRGLRKVPAVKPVEIAQPKVSTVDRELPMALDEYPVPDDLTLIEGIGPKISATLNIAGITTFVQLASTEVDCLQKILTDAGLRLADPGSWPKQAQLAAAGDMDGLRELQDHLKGGR